MRSTHSDDDLTLIGQTDFRGERKPFGIRRADRRAHIYIIGKTGTGKSTLIRSLTQQDIANGEGCALLDPHGDLVEQVLRAVPAERQADLIYFNVADTANAMAFNPLESPANTYTPLLASSLISVFKKMWAEFWGPRMEYLLRNALLAMLEFRGATLLDVTRLLQDTAFRRKVVSELQNPEVKNFWLREYEGYPDRLRAEAIAPIQNKLGEFAVNPVLRRILAQPNSAFNLRDLMDNRKILLVNLAKGRIGEDTAALLGGVLVAQFGIAALSRADMPEHQRQDFYLYVDEFPSFTTGAFAGMLAEMRKYRLSLTLAHQHLTQLEEQTRDAILGNAGTTIAFRVGPSDAEELEKEFSPELRAIDLIGLPNHHAYVKLMIDGVVSRPFSDKTSQPQKSRHD